MDEALAEKDYLSGDFSAADVMLGHACFMSDRSGSVTDEMTPERLHRSDRCENRI